jgi:hypothetical protein
MEGTFKGRSARYLGQKVEKVEAQEDGALD